MHLCICLWFFNNTFNSSCQVETKFKTSQLSWKGSAPRKPVAYAGISFGGVQQIQLRTEDREKGDLGAVRPLVRGCGGSCNLVQEI